MTNIIRRQNLKRFAFRQSIENDKMRARIYDRLRDKYGIKEATPHDLGEIAMLNNDAYGMGLCHFAEQLLIAHAALLRAEMTVLK